MRPIMQGMVVLGCLTSSTSFADNAAGSSASSYVFALPKSREAHDHLKRGVRLYNNQSFDAAIEEFKAGALAEPCATFDYNLGQSYRQLGRYKEALWHYQRFLTYGNPTGEVLDAVHNWITEMQSHLANAARTMPPTSAVADSEATPPRVPTSSAPATAGSPPPAMPDMRARTAKPDDRRGSINWLGWTVTVGGAAALGTAGFLVLRASNLDDQANRNLDALARNDLHDQAHTRRVASAIVGVGGVALTATGMILLIRGAYRDNQSATTSLDIGVTSHSVAVLGRF